jgi:predicted alpha/beta superfamily hydrolase
VLKKVDVSLSALLPNTTYFEFDSASVGGTFGVWVTTPPGYDPDGTDLYPAIFMPDGNLLTPSLAPTVELGPMDLIFPIRPVIHVAVGYCGAEARNLLVKRMRDLLPPGEPSSQHYLRGLDAAAESGILPAAVVAEYKIQLADGHADAFLRFLTDELYPDIIAHWRVDPATTGFWGDSYGGLFAIWLALQRVPQFPRVGAGSPGMITGQSKVFDLLEREIATGADHTGRHLHVSIAEGEITVPSFYQGLGEQFMRFVRILGETPLKGLTLTRHVVPHESHFSGLAGNFSSFLRACYTNPA